MGFARQEYWSGLPLPSLKYMLPIFKTSVSLTGVMKTTSQSSFATATIQADADSIPGLRRSPGEGNGNPLQYYCLEDPHGQRSLAGYSLWGHEESDTTERLHIYVYILA